jgi:TonB-dependent SusC/RagA subfamily outer membrane receptor
VGTIEAEDLHGRPAVQLEELLEGQVAGAQVVRMPGGGIAIRIRGPGSITGDTEPLYILDGMPVHVAPGAGLYWLNPGDVAKIEILKDAGGTSMYGMRGANGVVLITTKHGRRTKR